MIELRTRNESLRLLETYLLSNRELIPPLPEVLVRVQTTLDDRGASARDVARVILEDPLLTAKILKLANSAYYRHSAQGVKTITAAIILVGFEAIRNLVLGLHVYQAIDRLPRSAGYREVWQHSTACAVASRRIAKLLHVGVPEEAFVAGLLHDIGKIFLAHVFPEPYEYALRIAREEKLPIRETEKTLLKIDHAEAGQYIGDFWHFPDQILLTIRRHHLDDHAAALKRLDNKVVKSVILANRLVHYLYPAENEMPPSLKAIQDLATEGLGLPADIFPDLFDILRNEIEDFSHILQVVSEESPVPEEKAFKSSSPLPSHPPSDAEKLHALLLIHETAAECGDLPELLQKTIASFVSALQLDHIFLLFANRTNDHLECKFSYGPDAKAMEPRLSIGLSGVDDVAACAYLRNTTVVVETSNLPQFTRLGDENVISILGTFNLAATPISVGGRVRAVLLVSRPYDGSPLSPDDARLLRSYAQAMALVMARHYQRGGTTILRRDTSEIGR